MLLRGTYGPIWRESVRVLFPLVMNVFLFGMTAYFIKTDALSPESLFYTISAMLVLAGTATALLQGGVFGLASRFPPKYTQALMGGQGIAGLTVSVTAASTSWLRPPSHVVPTIEDVRGPAFMYFVVAVGVIGLGILGFAGLALLPYAHYHARKNALRSRAISTQLSEDEGEVTHEGMPGGANGTGGTQWGAGRPRSGSVPMDVNGASAGPASARGRVADLRHQDSMASQSSAESLSDELSTSAAMERDSMWMGGRFMRFVKRTASTRGVPRRSRSLLGSTRRGHDDLEALLLSDEGDDDSDTSAAIALARGGPRVSKHSQGHGIGPWETDTPSDDGPLDTPPPPSHRSPRSWRSWRGDAGESAYDERRLRVGVGWGQALDVSANADVAPLALATNGVRTRAIVRRLGAPACTAWAVVVVTLSVFPGVVASIGTSQTTIDPRITGDMFTPVMFVLFNVGDTLGRFIAGVWPKKAPSDLWLLTLAALRLGFIPLFLLCAVDTAGGGDGGVLPVLFGQPAYPVVFVIVMAITNGHLGAVAMMHAPQRLSPPLRDEGGGLMALFLTIGLCMGSFLALGLRALVCNCNPLA